MGKGVRPSQLPLPSPQPTRVSLPCWADWYLGMLKSWGWWSKSPGMGPRQTPHESQCPCTLLHHLCSHTRAYPLLFLPKKGKFEQKFIMVWTILQIIISSYRLISIWSLSLYDLFCNTEKYWWQNYLTLCFPVELGGRTGIKSREFNGIAWCVYFCTGGWRKIRFIIIIVINCSAFMLNFSEQWFLQCDLHH